MMKYYKKYSDYLSTLSDEKLYYATKEYEALCIIRPVIKDNLFDTLREILAKRNELIPNEKIGINSTGFTKIIKDVNAEICVRFRKRMEESEDIKPFDIGKYIALGE